MSANPIGRKKGHAFGSRSHVPGTVLDFRSYVNQTASHMEPVRVITTIDFDNKKVKYREFWVENGMPVWTDESDWLSMGG